MRKGWWGPSKTSRSPFFIFSVTARTTHDFTPSHNHVWAESDFTAVLWLQLSNHSLQSWAVPAAKPFPPEAPKIRDSHTSPASTLMLLLTALTTALASKMKIFGGKKTSKHHLNFVILQRQGTKLEIFPFLTALVFCCAIHNHTKLTQHYNFYFSFLSSHSPWLPLLKPRVFPLQRLRFMRSKTVS